MPRELGDAGVSVSAGVGSRIIRLSTEAVRFGAGLGDNGLSLEPCVLKPIACPAVRVLPHLARTREGRVQLFLRRLRLGSGGGHKRCLCLPGLGEAFGVHLLGEFAGERDFTVQRSSDGAGICERLFANGRRFLFRCCAGLVELLQSCGAFLVEFRGVVLVLFQNVTISSGAISSELAVEFGSCLCDFGCELGAQPLSLPFGRTHHLTGAGASVRKDRVRLTARGFELGSDVEARGLEELTCLLLGASSNRCRLRTRALDLVIRLPLRPKRERFRLFLGGAQELLQAGPKARVRGPCVFLDLTGGRRELGLEPQNPVVEVADLAAGILERCGEISHPLVHLGAVIAAHHDREAVIVHD